MKALAVTPGQRHSARLIDVPPPPASEGSVLVRGLALGICGTDAEILAGGYGVAPSGDDCLILGHESLGEVIEAPQGSGFAPGDLVVGIVRRPDPAPCPHCAIGEWDMCSNGLAPEAGIGRLQGYGREQYRLDPEFAIHVPPALGQLGVLIEPASVVAKACSHALYIRRRASAPAKVALVTGAGPIGLLAALLITQAGFDTYVVDLVESGPKPELARALGAHYHAGSARDLRIEADVVLECTGIGGVLRDAGSRAAHGSVMALVGITTQPAPQEFDLNRFNRDLVLNNRALFGSVNAGRGHYEGAAAALSKADPAWLAKLITRRVPLEHWQDALSRSPNDVKVVIDLAPTR
jgi:threonine dehydrogenase-like Zn-dependent dehydrogenase